MDPRDPRGMNAAFDACRMGMDGLEYFEAIGMGPFANRSHSQGPYPPGYDQEMMIMGGNQQNTDDLVRRTNLLVQFVNGQITCAARYGQLQPKMCVPMADFLPIFAQLKQLKKSKLWTVNEEFFLSI